MEPIKLTKNELRSQKVRLTQLEKYLPTLQLKKAMLQVEVNEARSEIKRLESSFHQMRLTVSHAGGLYSAHIGYNLSLSAKVERIEKHYENIAGVDIPVFEGVTFAPFDYPLFATPPWLDGAIIELRKLAIEKAKVRVAEEKKSVLERELREVTIRVNLFEKNLIPRAKKNIKKIKDFLGDQEINAVSRAKVAKKKIEMRKA